MPRRLMTSHSVLFFFFLILEIKKNVFLSSWSPLNVVPMALRDPIKTSINNFGKCVCVLFLPRDCETVNSEHVKQKENNFPFFTSINFQYVIDMLVVVMHLVQRQPVYHDLTTIICAKEKNQIIYYYSSFPMTSIGFDVNRKTIIIISHG